MQIEQTSDDLLTIEEYYTRATAGKRLANYLIDLVIFYILAFGLAVLLALIAPSIFEDLDNETVGFGLLDRVLSLVMYALYMFIVEAVFKGKSLGKLITRTRAVNLDGSHISASTAFARGFSRAVPFCSFSALGNPCNPWQDKWTKTMVVNERN